MCKYVLHLSIPIFMASHILSECGRPEAPLATDTTYDSFQYEPNDGGSCGSAPGDTSNYYKLGTRKFANVDNGGCRSR
jgi:hypothetical protein